MLSHKCYKIFVIKEQDGHIYIMLMYANGKKFRKKGLPYSCKQSFLVSTVHYRGGGMQYFNINFPKFFIN